MTIEELIAKYGTQTLSLLLRKAGLEEPAADVQSAFEDYMKNTKVRITRDETSWTPWGFDLP